MSYVLQKIENRKNKNTVYLNGQEKTHLINLRFCYTSDWKSIPNKEATSLWETSSGEIDE